MVYGYQKTKVKMFNLLCYFQLNELHYHQKTIISTIDMKNLYLNTLTDQTI